MVMVPFLAGRDCFFLTSKPGRPSRPAFFALRGTPASRPRCIGGDERSAPRLPLLKPLVAHKRESNWPRPTVAPIGPGLFVSAGSARSSVSHSSGIDVPMKRQVSLGCVGTTDCAITRHYSLASSSTGRGGLSRHSPGLVFSLAQYHRPGDARRLVRQRNGYDQRRAPPAEPAT